MGLLKILGARVVLSASLLALAVLLGCAKTKQNSNEFKKLEVGESVTWIIRVGEVEPSWSQPPNFQAVEGDRIQWDMEITTATTKDESVEFSLLSPNGATVKEIILEKTVPLAKGELDLVSPGIWAILLKNNGTKANSVRVRLEHYRPTNQVLGDIWDDFLEFLALLFTGALFILGLIIWCFALYWPFAMAKSHVPLRRKTASSLFFLVFLGVMLYAGCLAVFGRNVFWEHTNMDLFGRFWIVTMGSIGCGLLCLIPAYLWLEEPK